MKTTILALTASLIGLAATAFAQNQKPPAPGQHEIGAADQAATRAYWTAERMANAKPMPLPRVDPAIGGDASPLAPPEPAHFAEGGLPTILVSDDNLPSQTFEMLDHGEPATAPQTSPFSYEYPFNNYQPPVIDEYPYSTVGKLFFVIPPGASEPAGNYVCSGSVMANSYTVLTARHCMYDIGTGIWYNSWVFDPAYNSGPNSKYGNSWTPRKLETWVSGSTYDYDIGLMQMNDADGAGCNGSDGSKTLGNYTGYLGWMYGGDYTQRQWDVFGYPQASPFDGNHMYQDEAATGLLNPFGNNNIVEIGNPQTGGTSGGPWIIGFNPNHATDPAPSNNTTNKSGGNYANGLNSFQWTSPSQPYAINGPAFLGYNMNALFTAYKKLSCP
jgi:V8-like Glu-specific endopeptidase